MKMPRWRHGCAWHLNEFAWFADISCDRPYQGRSSVCRMTRMDECTLRHPMRRRAWGLEHEPGSCRCSGAAGSSATLGGGKDRERPREPSQVGRDAHGAAPIQRLAQVGDVVRNLDRGSRTLCACPSMRVSLSAAQACWGPGRRRQDGISRRHATHGSPATSSDGGPRYAHIQPRGRFACGFMPRRAAISRVRSGGSGGGHSSSVRS